MAFDAQRTILEQGITQNARHIFRQAPGHFSDDNSANRQLILDTATDPDSSQGQDKYGTHWHAKTLPTGDQVWVQVRHGKIRNAGINSTSKPWTADTGLAGLS